MPHLTIEYSANAGEAVDLDGFCAAMNAAMLATGLFEHGAIRVRALRAEHWAIADRDEKNAIVDLVLRMGMGRSLADRKAAGEAIFAAAADHLAPLFPTPHLSLSLEIREIEPELNWKRNAIQERLRGTG